MKLRERLWVWGHPKDSLKGGYLLQEGSPFDPADGMVHLGAKNIWYVPMGRVWDKEQATGEAEAAAAKEIGWSLERPKEHPEKLDELIALSGRHPDMTRAILDDFLNPENAQGITTEDLADFEKKLHGAENPLELWMVFYSKQFDMPDLESVFQAFDGVTLWFWNESEAAGDLEGICRRFFELTPGRKRMIGCYLYDFGGNCPADPELVRKQLDLYETYLREGLIEGVILHTNAVCGLGLAAPEAARAWVAEHGDDEV